MNHSSDVHLDEDHGFCASMSCLWLILQFLVLSAVAFLCSHVHKCLILGNSGPDHVCHLRAWGQQSGNGKSHRSMGFDVTIYHGAARISTEAWSLLTSLQNIYKVVSCSCTSRASDNTKQ